MNGNTDACPTGSLIREAFLHVFECVQVSVTYSYLCPLALEKAYATSFLRCLLDFVDGVMGARGVSALLCLHSLLSYRTRYARLSQAPGTPGQTFTGIGWGHFSNDTCRKIHMHPRTMWLRTLTVKSCIKSCVWLEPHFLQTQVAHKPHSNKSCILKMAPNTARGGLNCTAFALPKCFFTFWFLKQFCDIHKVKFRLHSTCHIVPDCCHGFCRRGTLHKSRPQVKAAPKSWKIAHKPRLLYTTLWYAYPWHNADLEMNTI